jgi:hypothetical protein
MPNVVRTYVGRCNLTFEFDVKLDADFRLELRSDGDVRVYVTMPFTQDAVRVMQVDEGRELVACSLRGRVSCPEGEVIIPKLLLNVRRMEGTSRGTSAAFELICASYAEIEYSKITDNRTVEVHYGLTNFAFLGCEYSHTANGAYLDKFRSVLGGIELTFKRSPDHEATVEALAKSHDVAVTAEAVATVPSASLEHVKELIDDATILLSYATGTYVASIYQDVYSNGQLLKSVLHFAKTGPYVHREWVIDGNNLADCDLRVFLETCYPIYRALRSDFSLDIVLEFLVISNQGRYSEVRFLLDSVAAECLLSHMPSYFAKIGKTADMSSFRNRMKGLLNHFGVMHEDHELDFILIRDKIVHTGRFPSEVDRFSETMKLSNLLDRTMLTILGYRGRFYLNCANQYARELL